MKADIEGRENFVKARNVSRETLSRLDIYAELLRKWNPVINLVSRSTVSELWSRHFLDSAQIIPMAGKSGHWVDVGSGGGFPGMVCAILADDNTKLTFTLVESDQRKATFIRTVSRETGVPVTVIAARIEDIAPLEADVISARALAPLNKLLHQTERHLKQDGRALFLKGATFRRELEEALETWSFQSNEYPSSTDSAGMILSLGEIRRV